MLLDLKRMKMRQETLKTEKIFGNILEYVSKTSIT